MSARRLRPPTPGELDEIASTFGLELSGEDVSDYLELLEPLLRSYARLDELSQRHPSALTPRRARVRDLGRPPTPEENPLGAWTWLCEVAESGEGPLAGKTVALKDNVCLAGVPMSVGTGVLEGYVPTVDATIVTRLLAAGATIVGKAACESLCFSGGSHTGDLGVVRNPHDRVRSTGGSSSGSAALVAAGEVSLAVGGDQAGSIRIPASWCGIYGLKPTFGLVPYSGIFPMEHTLDHAGPMARTVAELAAMLEVIAGPDGLDPRQGNVGAEPFRAAPRGSGRALRVGVLAEGFGWRHSEPAVDEAVRAALEHFASAEVQLQPLAVPWHQDALHVYNAVSVEGSTSLLLDNFGIVTNSRGQEASEMGRAYARGRLAMPERLPATVVRVLLLGRYLERLHEQRYDVARNLVSHLSAAYDDAFEHCDVLAMPTVPMRATPLPAAACSRAESLLRAHEMIHNTCPFNLTGHPAISLPCAVVDGLPVGLMLVGPRGADALVLEAAAAFEREVFAAPASPAGEEGAAGGDEC